MILAEFSGKRAWPISAEASVQDREENVPALWIAIPHRTDHLPTQSVCCQEINPL